MTIHPFRDGDTLTAFRTILDRTKAEIHGLENEYVLKASATELERYFVEKASIEPLVLKENDQHIERQRPTTITRHDYGDRIVVNGTALDIAIPYTGDRELWRLSASTFGISGYPDLDVREDVVAFTYSFQDDGVDAGRVKQEIARQVKSLVDAVSYLAHDVANHNRTAAEEVRRALAHKRRTAETTLNAVAALGIPIKRRDQPATYAVPAKRRPSPVSRPPVSTEKFAPEPVLPQEEYEFILGILKSMGRVMERDAAAFVSLEEPGIRTHFLLQLNGHYEGMATGETFNAVGKTDILIRVRDRNVFIAECKFWRGDKSFDEAIDQLLSYLSWRDSKCALLIFNTNRDSSAVCEKMHKLMQARSECRKVLTEPKEGDARYIFVKPSDPGREIQVATMLFDVPRAA